MPVGAQMPGDGRGPRHGAGRPVRRALAAALVAGMALPAFAEGVAICSTERGWCPLREAEMRDEATCLCADPDGEVAGLAVTVARTNPLTRIDAPSQEAYRRIPSMTAASRAFAGPGQMPPRAFAAYGVVVFKARATRFDRWRHEIVCEAYLATLPTAAEVDLPPSEQMATIWPLRTDAAADGIETGPPAETCAAAIDGYGLVQAQNALALIRTYAADPAFLDDREGPFLVAWTPASRIAEPDSVALLADLSHVADMQDALEALTEWRREIQGNPDLWTTTPSARSLRERLRSFLDRTGTALLEFDRG
jgi:hypothetical protein